MILVGDPYQSIYGWLGAVDAMNTITTDVRCFLTQSFRFGPAIAEVANQLLARLGADMRLQGHPAIHSTVGSIVAPKAVLTRTNAEALRQVFDHLDAGRTVALVGGNAKLAAFCRAAVQLADTGATSHPELACFTSWGQVVDYAKHDQQGSELKLLVELIDRFGAPPLLDALNHTTSEDTAEVVISTAHKSKGREWDSVALAGDYPPPKTGHDDNSAEELRLLYVAVTRARHHLDISHVPHATTAHNPQPSPAPPAAPSGPLRPQPA